MFGIMNKTPFAIVAITVVALGGYAVCNRPSQVVMISDQDAPAPIPDTLDPDVRFVIDELCTKWESIEKLSAVFHTLSPTAAGFKGKTEGTGSYAYQKTDSDPLIRVNIRNMLTIEKETTLSDGKISPVLYTAEMLLTLHDGDTVWNQLTQHANKKLYKRKYDASEVLQFGGKALWDTLAIGTTVTRLPDEKVKEVGDTEAYVFSVAPLDGDWTSTHWFDKKTGLRLKTVEKDLDGVETLTMWLDEINYDPEFAEDQFIFTNPTEGWEIIDETGEHDATQEETP
jgi:outer membrane lipoprotein-sorting protein